ncbi:hypothetical protein E2C01_068084 [Portunus trituberculatus]|uniref:Uncharacterized protein n=1 Tax=Portunus trituberculatus TaxID=210409 RepID=A0A5B7HWY5_PORTR|nr:hypothetical protein [Portunus trituberculatus]
MSSPDLKMALSCTAALLHHQANSDFIFSEIIIIASKFPWAVCNALIFAVSRVTGDLMTCTNKLMTPATFKTLTCLDYCQGLEPPRLLAFFGGMSRKPGETSGPSLRPQF